MEFFKFFWEDLSDHILNVVNYFFENAVMPKAWGRTYIVLNPKKEHSKFAYVFVQFCFAMLLIR